MDGRTKKIFTQPRAANVRYFKYYEYSYGVTTHEYGTSRYYPVTSTSKSPNRYGNLEFYMRKICEY